MADLVKANNKNGKKTKMILPVDPTQQYPIFADIVNKEKIDCRNLRTFNMDEYLNWQGRPIPEDHPMSFKRCMKELLWSRVAPELRMSEKQMYFPNPQRINELDDKLDELGGADVCYAGVGYHGHVAFNEAIISRWYKIHEEEFLNARTHIVSIADDTFVINSVREAGGNCEIIPPFAITIGMKDIMDSKHIEGVFYCGTWQRTVFRRTLFQEPTIEYPGTFLKRHPDFGVSIDAETAKPPEIAPY
ncbi:MAG: glucosamine-6-phosphate isomerase [Planctomycetes bacterium]|nr:glucosamine-6-phosphate isomerase [Planctomycetota bacterium]